MFVVLLVIKCYQQVYSDNCTASDQTGCRRDVDFCTKKAWMAPHFDGETQINHVIKKIFKKCINNNPIEM